MEFKVRGIIVPIVTPFDGAGNVDTVGVTRLVDYLIDRGIAGLFSGGTTGEGFLLSLDERRQLAEGVVAAADGRAPVIVHAGAASTPDAVALSRHAQAVGAQAVAVIPPFVYRHSEAGLLRHFVAVAASVPELPVYLYNFPAICNNTLTVELVQQIMEEAPNVVGMKDSSGSLDALAELVAVTGGRFNAVSGPDGLALMALALGFDGCVSGNANVVPELMVSLYDAVKAGEMARARKCQERLNRVRALLQDGGNLSLFKQMVRRRGVEVGDVRGPLLPADDVAVDAIAARLTAEVGLLETV